MLRTIANANLTFEELLSVLAEIETILNSQSIVPLSEDPNDGEALTPAHLLIRSAFKTIPEKIAKSPVVNHFKRYQLISHLMPQLWRMFQRDYILGQQQKVKCNTILS